MPALKGSKNAAGNSGGKSLQDRIIASRVRKLALGKIEELLMKEKSVLLKDGEYELYKQVLMRLAGTILPRLNEVTGDEGGPLRVEIAKEIAEKHGIDEGAS